MSDDRVRIWQVIARPDQLDIGVKPAKAIGAFTKKYHAEYFGQHLYGRSYEVRSTTIDQETYQEIFYCE